MERRVKITTEAALETAGETRERFPPRKQQHQIVIRRTEEN